MIQNKFDLVYPEASKKTDGLMSSVDKMKLDSINIDDIEYIKEGIKEIKASRVPQFIYGIEIDMDNSDPTASVKYTDDSTGFAPLTVDQTTGACVYGSWYTFIHTVLGVKPCLFKGGKVISYLNENDYSKTTSGNNIDIESGGYGDVMIEFSKIYYKLSRMDNKITFKVSNKKVDSSWSDAAFACNDGLETVKDKMYISAYNGVVLNAKLRSVSNQMPTYNIDFKTLSLRATANGSRYQLNSIIKHTFIKYLTYMVTKSLNIRSKIGKGNSNNTSLIKTGTMNKNGLFYGTNSGTTGVKIFGIENLYGNISEFVNGLTIHLNTLRYKKAGPYDNLKSFIEIEEFAALSGYIKREKLIDGILSLPESTGASSSTYFCGYTSITNNTACIVGGYGELNCGLSYILFIKSLDETLRVGGRLCY